MYLENLEIIKIILAYIVARDYNSVRIGNVLRGWVKFPTGGEA